MTARRLNYDTRYIMKLPWKSIKRNLGYSIKAKNGFKRIKLVLFIYIKDILLLWNKNLYSF